MNTKLTLIIYNGTHNYGKIFLVDKVNLSKTQRLRGNMLQVNSQYKIFYFLN